MPLTDKGREIMAALEKEYGPDKAKEVFYAGKNAGRFTGVDSEDVKADSAEMVRAAGVMFLTPDKQTLFLKRGNGGDYPGMWALPGGRLEGDETASQAAIREVEEETGFKAEGLKFWTRRIAPHETTGAQPSPQDGLPVAEPVPNAIIPPGDAIVVPGLPVDFTTFVHVVSAPFTPTLNYENTGYAWAPIGEPPEPLHPGCRIALARADLDELGVARAIASGELTSPQRYDNFSLFAIRITGTGAAYRKGLDEFCWRDPAEYLNDDFIAKCAGLPVIFEHPKKRTLNSEEFSDRVIGAVMFAYIVGDEVWAIARIYDDSAIALMENNQLSTSPAVVLKDDDSSTTVEMDGGKKLLIEGGIRRLDHIAICEHGVWDKGGEPSGIISEPIGESIMTEEEMKAKEKADAEARAKADAENTDKLDKLLTAVGCLTDSMDSLKARVDSMEKAKADAEETAEAKAEREAKEKADAEAEAKEKADAEEAERAEKAKADAEALRSRLDAVEASMPKDLADEDYTAMADAQARADHVLSTFGKNAPRPLQGENPLAYRRRLARDLQAHSKDWKDTNLAKLEEGTFAKIEDRIYADALSAGMSPASAPIGTLKEIKRADQTGRVVSTFVGDPMAWMGPFMSTRNRVKRFNIGKDQ